MLSSLGKGAGAVWWCCLGDWCGFFLDLLNYYLIFIHLFIILSLEYCHIHFLLGDIFVERSDKVDICIGQF